jgi:hypothetical protein
MTTLFGVAFAATVLVAPIAVDDPTPPTPYQVPGPDGPVLPGNQVLPPVCLHAMRACGYTLDPGTMTWRPSGTGARPRSTSYNHSPCPALSPGQGECHYAESCFSFRHFGVASLACSQPMSYPEYPRPNFVRATQTVIELPADS